MKIEELKALAPSLVPLEDGIWGVPHGAVSFPHEGHQECLQVEADSFWFRHRNNAIVELCRALPPAGTIFDVGGGNGFVAKGLREAGFDVVLVEPGRDGARAGAARGLSPVVCATLDAFQPGSLPAVSTFDVIEHIEDDHGFVRRLRDALKPGGRLYVTVPAYQWLWSSSDQYAGHFRRYTLGSIRSVVEANGFCVERATYLFAPLPPAILLFRALARGADGGKEGATDHRESAAMDFLLDRELELIRRGATIPFGSSVLLGARRA